MSNKHSLLSLGFAVILVGCSASSPSPAPVDNTPVVTDRGPGELFGEAIDPTLEVVDFDKLLASPDDYSESWLETRGIVRASCQIRGCWMEVRSLNDVAGKAVTVRFKDYGFFVPLDARGAEARFQGVFKLTTYSPAQVMELEHEGGSFDSKLPDGSAKVLGFTASSVEMWRE